MPLTRGNITSVAIPKQSRAIKQWLGTLGNKKAQPKKLTDVARLAIMLHLEGLTHQDIARETGYSPQWVSMILRSNAAQEVINDYLDFMDQEFRALYKRSINAIRSALDSENETVALRAADMFLRAHGKYAEKRDSADTAEDLIKRIDQMVQIQQLNVYQPNSLGHTPTSSNTILSIPNKENISKIEQNTMGGDA